MPHTRTAKSRDDDDTVLLTTLDGCWYDLHGVPGAGLQAVLENSPGFGSFTYYFEHIRHEVVPFVSTAW